MTSTSTRHSLTQWAVPFFTHSIGCAVQRLYLTSLTHSLTLLSISLSLSYHSCAGSPPLTTSLPLSLPASHFLSLPLSPLSGKAGVYDLDLKADKSEMQVFVFVSVSVSVSVSACVTVSVWVWFLCLSVWPAPLSSFLSFPHSLLSLPLSLSPPPSLPRVLLLTPCPSAFVCVCVCVCVCVRARAPLSFSLSHSVFVCMLAKTPR